MADPAAGDAPLTRWKLWNWFRRIGVSSTVLVVGDAQSTQNSLLLDLPPEIRGWILKFVSPADQKSLRLSCHQLNYDIENDTGVRITCSSFEQEEAEPEQDSMMSCITTGPWFRAERRQKREACWNLQWLWLQSIRVVSLHLSLNSLLPLPPPEVSLLRNPSFLKTLTLRFVDAQDIRDQILHLLNPLTGLRTVYLEYAERPRFLYSNPNVPDIHPVSRDELRDYNVTMSNFYVDILRNLNSSKSLTSLTIYVKSYSHHFSDLLWFPLFDSYIGFPPPFQVPPIQIPSHLHKLIIQHELPFRDVLSPYDLGNQLHIWKALLAAQTQLTSLSTLIGKVYWRYYETVMNNCRSTLKSLEISCGNWNESRFSPGNLDEWLEDFYTEEVDIPAPDLFNWTTLFGSNCLESLHVYMSGKSHRSGNGTVHFCHKSFVHLKELRLVNVKLSQEDLREVLLELPGLKQLHLKEWYIASKAEWNFTDYMTIFEQTFDYIRAAVVLGRLEDIKLFGVLVSGIVYSPPALKGFQRSAIVNPGYQVTWSPKCTSLYKSIDQEWWSYREPTLHIRKRL